MHKRLLMSLLCLILVLTVSAQYKAPSLNLQKAITGNHAAPASLLPDSLQARFPLLPDSAQLVAATKAARKNVAKRLPYGSDLKTHLVIDDGTRVMGSITLWSMGDFTGIASVRPTDGAYPESVATGIPIGYVAAYDGEHYYGKNYSSAGGQVYANDYYVYNTKTWEQEKHVKLPAQYSQTTTIMAYNPHDGQIWGVLLDGYQRPFLGTVDKETGENTFIGQTPFTGNLGCMAFDADGNCYGINGDGMLVKVDINTGVCTDIANVAPDGLKWGNALAFDYHTGMLYWTNLKNDWSNSLNRINPKDGSVEKVCDLPGSFEMMGLYVISPEAPNKAPNTVAKLSVDFGGSSSTMGKVSITAPTITFDGSDLTGTLTMNMYVDSTLVETRSQDAGSTLTISHDFKTAGDHKLQVAYTNNAGTGPTGTITPFCGVDTPTDVTGLTMTTDDQTGVTTVSWQPSARGIHGGYINPDDLTYSVLRMPDSVLVASGLKDLSFTETLQKDAGPLRYYYRVWPTAGGIKGYPATSNSIVFGKALDTPVNTYLGNDGFNELLTTENRDGHGDGFYGGWGVEFVNGGNSDTAFVNDKWCYLPAIHLKKGTYYYQLQHEGHGFDLYYGKYRTPESQKEHHIGTIDSDVTEYDYATANDNSINSGGHSSYITYKRLIDIAEEGDYYFGITYDYVYPGKAFTSAQLRQFIVKEGPAKNAPIECTLDSAKTFPKGELKNHIYFTTPTKDYNGATLSDIDKVEFYLSTDTVDDAGRKTAVDKFVYEMDEVEPGKSYVADVPAHQGQNTYYVYAYNSNGRGGESETSLWAGKDIPSTVSNPRYEVIDNKDINMSWDAPSEIGYHGGYVDSTLVTYDAGVAQSPSNGLVTLEGMGDLTEKHYTFYGDLGEQYRYYYGVTPKDDLGQGVGIMVPIVIGKPYTAPFKESFNFSNGAFKTQFWDLLLVAGSHSWSAASQTTDGSIVPHDGDDGMLVFQHANDEICGEVLQTPIMEITGSQKPVLSFWFHHNPDVSDHYAGITVYPVVDDVMQEAAASIGLNGGPDVSGWKHYEIPLDKYKGEKRVYFYFFASSEKKEAVLALDDIELYDNVPTDLALETLSTPAAIAPNEENDITVKVQNRGRNTLDSYTLGLYANDELVQQATGNNLPLSGEADVTFRYTPSPSLFASNVNYTVRVMVADDQNPDNDSLSTTLYVKGTVLPAPQNLSVEKTAQGVNLVWQAPAEPTWTQTREDFESYTPYIINNIGEWTSYDGDGQLSYAPNDGNGYAADFDNNWCAKSFQVWTPEGLTLVSGLRGNVMKLYGKQCLISFDVQGYYPDLSAAESAQTDDWLISPRVAGGTTVKFYAKEVTGNQHEKYQVLVSYGTQKPEDFAVLLSDSLSDNKAKHVEVTLPEDAHYFAIRNVSVNGFALLIDNIDYTPGYTDLEFLGYNVYRDGMKLNTEPVTTLDYNDEGYNGGALYGVTAVYDYDGESNMSTAVLAGITSLTSTKLTVESLGNTITVNGASGQAIRIYTSAGQLMANQRAAAPTETFTLPAGIYLVKVGGMTKKVILK